MKKNNQTRQNRQKQNRSKNNNLASQNKETERDKTEENIEEPDLLEIKIKEEEYETLDLEEELGIDRDLSSQPVQNKSSRFPRKENITACGTTESTTNSIAKPGLTNTKWHFGTAT